MSARRAPKPALAYLLTFSRVPPRHQTLQLSVVTGESAGVSSGQTVFKVHGEVYNVVDASR